MRELMFEKGDAPLARVPMAVRRGLDPVGVKIELKQWQALGRGERLAICHLAIDHENERETLKLFIVEPVERVRRAAQDAGRKRARDCGTAAHVAGEGRGGSVRRGRAPGPDGVGAPGCRRALRADQARGGARQSHNVAAALAEFGSSAERA